jgi:hypothetical protein
MLTFITGVNAFEAQHIYFTMDGTVLGTADDIGIGIGLLFSAYYVFNLEYEATCQVTLEFIQR